MRNEKLRQERIKRMLTLQKAAKKAAVGYTTFSRWEHGTQKPHLSSIRLLCEKFELSVEELGFTDTTNK